MPDRPVTLDLKALRELCERATPGPWSLYFNDGHWLRRPGNEDLCAHTNVDARFIAAARDAVPQLLDLVAAKDAEIERLRGLLREAQPWVRCGFEEPNVAVEQEARALDRRIDAALKEGT